ncbi:histidine phosphatase family protein [bacterium LRH843]|nr:histidine phosphatase family protein [bacterium LRH843]
MGDSLVLTLIRHGLTTYNEEKRYIGVTDLPLSALGKAQLVSVNVEEEQLLITSDLLRCKETAERLFPGKSYICLSDLREIDFGDWEGKTYDQLKDDAYYREWLDDPLSITPPSGESFVHFQMRIERAFCDVLSLVEKNDATYATIVTHGGVIRQMLTSLAPEKRVFFEWDVPIGRAFKLIGNKADARRGLRFTSLLEGPITAKTNGL